MGCTSCGEETPKNTNKDFTRAVIEINNPESMVLFRKVVIPTSMGTEEEVPAAIGKYRNVLLVYEANNHAYLYSSDGIPTLLASDTAQGLEERIDALEEGLQSEVTERQNTDNELSSRVSSNAGAIASETTARVNADAALSNRLTTVEGLASTAVQPSAIDKVVMTDISLNANTSTTTVQIDGAKENLLTGATSTKNIPLPVASSTEAGIMNSSTFDAVTNNTSNINALMNGAVAITGLSASPSQADLTAAWQAQTGLSTLMNRAGIYDVTNNKVWTYYSNSNTWYAASNTSQVSINTFTNSSEGTIKGSTNVGQIFAENDGTGSVNGWDALSGSVSTNTSNITSLQTSVAGKQDKLTAGNAITIENNVISANIYPADFFTNSATATGTGSNITINNTLLMPLKSLQLQGDTYQQTYSGKNLWGGFASDYSLTDHGVNFVSHKDGTISANGTADGQAYSMYAAAATSTGRVQEFPAGTYTLSGGTSTIRILFVVVGPGTTYTTNSTTGKITFTLDDTINGYIRAQVPNGSAVNETVYPQLELGSTATDYEPYVGGTPSPNPDYPQDIQTVTGEQTVSVTGKNLFGGLTMDRANYCTATLTNNILTITPTDTTHNTLVHFTFDNPIKSGDYILNSETPLSTSTQLRDRYNSPIIYNFSSRYSNQTFTLTQQAEGIAFNWQSTGTTEPFTVDLSTLQIEQGSTATAYEPYQSQTYPISFGATELCKIGDYQDYIYKDERNWYVHKEVGKIVYNGSETWAFNSTSVYPFRIAISDAANLTTLQSLPPNVVVNYYTPHAWDNTQRSNYCVTATISNTIAFRNTDITSLADWKTWLGSHNTIVYYPLATPTNTQITDTTLIGQLEALSGATSYDNLTVFAAAATGDNLPVLLSPEVYVRSLSGIIELIENVSAKIQDSIFTTNEWNALWA